MTGTWGVETPGVLVLPSGRSVRGRALRRPQPEGETPDFAVYLLHREPPRTPWPRQWLRWRDFGLPADPIAAEATLRQVWTRSTDERVELACGGGRGRTGTALACLAVLDGVAASDAVAYIRHHDDRRAVETPWQRRFVERFGA